MKKKYILRTIIILLIICWMNMVFGFSAQSGSKSSNLSLWVASLITKNENKQLILEPYIRKVAHFSEYGVGGTLFLSFLATFKIKEEKQIIYATIIGLIYAISDEIHQLFIEGRSGQFKDVYIDTLGVITGALIMCLIIKIFIKKERNEKNV